MGNKSSEFESQFFKRYSFIQNIDDKCFGQVKIYRKNTVKFDYIMILEIQLENLSESQIQILEQRLKLVRTYQNQSTLRIYFYKFLSPTRIQCRNRTLLVYAQYMNRSVLDYLCALRSNPKFVFDVSEIIYVLRNVSKGCIALKSNFETIQKWEQSIQTCRHEKCFYPQKEKLSYAHCSIFQNLQKDQLHITKYQKYSISCLHSISRIQNFGLKVQLTNLLLEMTGNISQKKLQETTFIYKLIQQSSNIQGLYAKLPQVETETMRIEQMQRMENIPGEFYDTN